MTTTLLFPLHATPCMDLHRGKPSLFTLVSHVVGDIDLTWRKAHPRERPGFVAGVKADPKAEPPVVAVPAVVPECAHYALDIGAEVADEQRAKLAAAFEAWKP